MQHKLGSSADHVTGDTTPLVTFILLNRLDLAESEESTREPGPRQAQNWPSQCIRLNPRGSLLESEAKITFMNPLLLLAAGGLLGFLIAVLAYRSRAQVVESKVEGLERDLASVREEMKAAQQENTRLQAMAASLDTELRLQTAAQEEKLAVVAQAKQEFREAFGALTSIRRRDA